MSTPARIFIEGSPAVFKKNDGYPSSVIPDIEEWLEAGRPGPFVEFIEEHRALDFPRKISVAINDEARETEIQYEPVYFESHEILGNGITCATAGVDYEYTVTLDGRIFEGRIERMAQDTETVVRVYVGADGTDINALADTLVPYAGGSTVLSANGRWRNDAGIVEHEPSAVVEVIFSDGTWDYVESIVRREIRDWLRANHETEARVTITEATSFAVRQSA